MSIELASVIWDELKRYINTVDRAEAAENFVSVLVDNDCDPEDIKDTFKGDINIKKALADYINNEQEEVYEEEDYEEDNYNEEDDY